MSTICSYKIRVKAPNKVAASIIFDSQVCLDGKGISHEKESENGYIMEFWGNEKNEVDCYCHEDESVTVDVKRLSEDESYYKDLILKLNDITLSQKSKMLNCEINVLEWNGETRFCEFIVIKDGIEKRIDVNPFSGAGDEPIYDDDGEEFSCFEGEYEYCKDDYESFKEFKEEEGLPSKLKLSKHFIKEDDGYYIIKAIGPQYDSEPECNSWTIEI